MGCPLLLSAMPIALLLCPLLLLACSAAPTVTPGPEASAAIDQPDTSTPLKLWPAVDTTSAQAAADVACLRRFFQHKLDRSAPQDYWSTAELALYGHVQPELLYAEYDTLGQLAYPPTLMDRRVMSDGSRTMRVKWSKGTGDTELVKQVFTFRLVDEADGPRLCMPLELNVRDWPRHTVGGITYIVSPARRFNAAEAQRQWEDCLALGRFFGMEPFPFTYLSFVDPAELFRARGFELHPRSYTFPTGGRLDHDTQVSAGNDRERYTHEVVHAFIFRALGRSGPDLLHEGTATYLGGSNARPYAHHRAVLAQLLSDQPGRDLCKDIDPYRSEYIREDSNLAYTVGAVLVEHILREHGSAGLFKLFAGDDLWGTLRSIDIGPTNFNAIIRAELARAPLGPALPEHGYTKDQ